MVSTYGACSPGFDSRDIQVFFLLSGLGWWERKESRGDKNFLMRQQAEKNQKQYL